MSDRVNLIRPPSGATIFSAGAQASQWGVVVQGLVRECRFDIDGNRELTGFRIRGEVFGIEPTRYSATIESLGDTLVRIHPNRLSLGDPDSLAALDSNIARIREDREIASRASVPSRLAAFLLDLSARGMGASLCLGMPRADMADYLRTTEPTISRILTDLQNRRILARGHRGAISIVNFAALEALGSRQTAGELAGMEQ